MLIRGIRIYSNDIRIIIKMEKKYKKFLFAIVVLAFLTAGGFASALEIKDYPNVPGVGTITKDSTLPQFVRYFFGLGMYLAGLIALISLTVGAVQYIMSAGNPGMAGDAADRMKGSILGLILLLSAFLIMKTINPVLTTPTITPLPETAGVYYMKGKELRPAQSSDPDLSAQKSEGFNMIKYKCSTKSEPNLIVWLYPKENFNPGSSDYKQVKVILVACEGEINMEGLSLKWMKETEGIYYFMEEGCAGFRSGPVLSSEDQISEPFKNNIKSIKVINNPGTSTYYGAIFHENIGADRGGECTEALMGGAVKNGAIDNYCADVSEYGISPSSVTVFRTNTKPLTSGNGVLLISSVGAESEMGRIAAGLEVARPEPPLIKRVRALSHQILIAVSGVAVVLFVASVAAGQPLIGTVAVILALIVSAVPEGLPIVLTIVLARGVHAMSKRKAIVRELAAVEALGGVDLIFTDKTGTLTKNQLRLVEAELPDGSRVTIHHDEEGAPMRHTGDIDAIKHFAEALGATADPAAWQNGELLSVDPINRAFTDLPRALGMSEPIRHDERPFEVERRTSAAAARPPIAPTCQGCQSAACSHIFL